MKLRTSESLTCMSVSDISALCRYASIPVYQVPLVAPWQVNLGAGLLWPLQIYWFSLICRGALRQLAAPRSASPCLTSNGCTSHQEDGRKDCH